MYIYNSGQKFRQVAAANPDKPALAFPDGSRLTFAELDRLSNQIAGFLAGQGLTRPAAVAILNDKRPFGLASMLACLKLGLVYTNIDYSNPQERLARIFDTARPALVLADREITPAVDFLCRERAIPRFSEADCRPMVESRPDQLPDALIEDVPGDNPAYIMFTSGSTGTPKGVLIRHGSVLNLAAWARRAYQLSPDDVLTNVNPIYFDNSVFDFYAALFNGLTLAVFPKNVVSRPAALMPLIEEMGCTFWFSVPSLLIYLQNMKLLTEDAFRTIKTFAFGGEGYPKPALKRLYELYGSRARLFNVYGPTEGTCICSIHQIRDEDFIDDDFLVTLGFMAPNFDYLILDEEGKPAEAGELCLMGPQLAAGYYNDPERTAGSFVQNPLNPEYDQKVYRTGDLVARRDGRLYFRGRADNQIKHMGYRIELEEIEAGLSKLPYVKQCAVVHGQTETGFSRLTAYLASSDAPEQKQIREDLKKYLPDYMIPQIFTLMGELPKNPNGKIDRARLKKLNFEK